MDWDKRYQIDVEFIDDQHREWIARVAKLGQAIDNGETTAAMASALKFVVEYTQKHFADEVAYMQEIRYPHVASQSKLHKAFETYIIDVLVNLKRGKAVPPAQLYTFMSDWIKQHIQEEDRQIGLFIGRSDAVDESTANTEEESPDPLTVRLKDLVGLVEAELITQADFVSKKQDMLRQFVADPSAEAPAESTVNLEKLKTLMGEGLLTEDDLMIGREQLVHAVDLAKELDRRDGFKAKMVHLKTLFDEAIITVEQFEAHKAEILSQM